MENTDTEIVSVTVVEEVTLDTSNNDDVQLETKVSEEITPDTPGHDDVKLQTEVSEEIPLDTPSNVDVLLQTEVSEEITLDTPNSDDVKQQTEVSEVDLCTDDVGDANQPNGSEVLPSYNLCTRPLQLCGAWNAFGENFTKGCKWSPDGSCILTNSDDNVLRLFNLPPHFYQMPTDWDEVEELTPVLCCSEGGLLYDYAWYPGMSSQVPASCCFASTSCGSPVHLWDAYSGELRCSYRSYNHLDEPVSAYSIAFDTHGDKLYCGFNKMVRVFDVCRPGRTFEERPTNLKKMGQPGYISCIAFGAPGMYAAGSYCKSVAMYSISDGQLQFIMYGHQGGVTHLKFSPDGTKLYSGGRKDYSILCWDIRNLGNVLYRMQRTATTNQRMYFDISRCGNYMISGNTNGIVTVWDLRTPPFYLDDLGAVMKPSLFFKDHKDCVNGVGWHPTLPMYATTSGERKTCDLAGDNSDKFFVKPAKDKSDNSLRIWWVPQEESSDM